jgi:hypothetical protein
MRFTAPTGSGSAHFVPRTLAAARAALARSEIGSRSCLPGISCIEKRLLGPRPFYAAAAFSSKGRLGSFRSITRMTCVAVQAPPRAVGMPRSLRPAAIARSDVAPAACTSAIAGARLPLICYSKDLSAREISAPR